MQKSNICSPVATVLTVYGIETHSKLFNTVVEASFVATVLTVYGIETCLFLQSSRTRSKLQQSLPFTVLKRSKLEQHVERFVQVATVLTVHGIET